MGAQPERRLSTQVLVIGSGAGGAITAATLAEAGFSVTIAEEGPEVDTSSIATNTPEAMQLLYRSGGMTPILGNPNIAFVEGRCVGGSTEINSAFWQRTPEDALARWIEQYQVQDLSYQDLEAIFEQIELELGVSFLRIGEPPPSSRLFKLGSEQVGWVAEEVPRALRIPYGGSQFAPGAKSSMYQTYIPKALRAGAQLLPDCRVIRVHHRRGRVMHVSAVLQTPEGRCPLIIEAEELFVCAGPIQTPLLLRASGIKRNIGDNLQIHPMLKMAALFDEPMESDRTAIPLYQVKEFWPDITLGGSVFTPGLLALTLSENWANLPDMRQEWHRMALYYAACRGSSRGTVRVFPLTHEPIVRYALSQRDQFNLSVGLARLGEALFAGGARRLFPALRAPAVLESTAACRVFLEKPIPISAMNLSTVHAFSTCPMGENQDVCATDSFGKIHGFENCYIGDASMIPESPGVNPQATVMALALRNAKHFVDHRK